MIYLVTNNIEFYETAFYQIIGVKESLQLLEPLKIVGLDTETKGLDPYTKELLSIQLGNRDFQVVIDCLTVNLKLYKEYLESDRTFLGWNLKFDLKFLYRQGIYPRNVYDGYLAEKLLWLGYPAGIHSLSLKNAGHNYVGVELDKTVRGKIIYTGLQTDVIVYAAEDVAHLEDIILAQWKEIQKKELQNAVKVENKFVLSLAYCEYCGIKLDEDKWKEKMEKDQKRQDEALESCNKWLVEHEPDSPYVYIDCQGDLFNGYNLEPQVKLNWNSAQQLIPLFKKYGLDLKTKDKATGNVKDSIDAKILKPQASKCSLVHLYLNYKEAVKVTSTYGQNFLDQINPVSHRIHTNFQQMGADTTRITSGGKDKSSHIEYVNLLNLPKDPETRACFVAEKGNKWISIDYSGQESFLMASIANDKAIIEELTNGSQDLHSLTAYMSYPQIPRGTSFKEIKEKYHDLRQEAKGIEFKRLA